MQYKINTKAFHEAFKEPKEVFYKNWVCPIHGARDYCSHYTEAFAKFSHDFMQKFIEPYTPQSLKPVGIHIAKKLVAPDGYEYGWKTVYNRVDNRVERICSNNSDYEATYRPPFHFELDEAVLKNLLFVGWIPVGWLYPTYKIPRNADGFYADGDAVLCMRIKYTKDSYKTNPEIYPLAQVVSEGCPVPDGTADIERDIANNFETLMDDTYYSMGNKHYKMPAENNELGATPMQTKDIVEHAKKHIVPGWEDNEANRIARKAIENMDRLESLGLKKQGETVDPRDVLLTESAIEQAIKNLRQYQMSDDEAKRISADQHEILIQLSNRKSTEDPRDELSLSNINYCHTSTNPDDIVYAQEVEDYAKSKGLDPNILSFQEMGELVDEIRENRKKAKVFETVTADPVPVEPAPEPKGYIYTGADAEVWAPIMESMESNIAKANALEKAKESFPLDALTLIMGYHFGKNTRAYEMDKRIDFIEKYRSLITVMGYSRF